MGRNYFSNYFDFKKIKFLPIQNIQRATYIYKYKYRFAPTIHFVWGEIILKIISISKIISPHTNCMGATYIKCRLLTEYESNLINVLLTKSEFSVRTGI